MLTLIENARFVSKEVKYHTTCRNQYQNETEKKTNKELIKNKSQWHDNWQLHNEAFSSLVTYNHVIVLAKKEVHLMDNIKRRYSDLLCEISGEDEFEVHGHKIKENLQKQFGLKSKYVKE